MDDFALPIFNFLSALALSVMMKRLHVHLYSKLLKPAGSSANPSNIEESKKIVLLAYPLMAIDLGTALLIAKYQMEQPYHIVGLTIVCVPLAITFFLQIPMHYKIISTANPKLLIWHRTFNRIRSICLILRFFTLYFQVRLFFIWVVSMYLGLDKLK